MRAALVALALGSCCAPAAAPAPCPVHLPPPPMVVIPEGYSTPFQLDRPTVLIVEMDLFDPAGDWVQRCLNMGGEPIAVHVEARIVTAAECDDVDY